MTSVGELIKVAASENPSARFGTFQQFDTLRSTVERADLIAQHLKAAGFGRGSVLAVLGTNCASYIVTWMAAQSLGIQTAQINPAYPDEFLAQMLDDLGPDAIVWIARAPGALVERTEPQFDASDAWNGIVHPLNDRQLRGEAKSGDCRAEDIAAYLHTSGTSGNPKFCALSHEYFKRLGRYFADVMGFARHDLVINPLPLFHINPIGNGLVGALTGRCGFLSTERFVADEFWGQVRDHGATALVLHGPPANLLKAKTTGKDAAGHKVRVGFACVPSFLREFDIPIGIGGYGSTEAGGFCHDWTFRPGDVDLPAEGALALAGRARHDVDFKLADDGEILVRGKAPHVLFSGYRRNGEVVDALDADGWFPTGDRGRLDDYGNLVFIERMSESIRVNAEYVPIDFVEDRLKTARSLADFALWRVPSENRGHEAVVYTTAPDADPDDVRSAVADLPRYMRPTQLIHIAAIPRDSGVGKVQRRLLDQADRLRVTPL